MHQSIRLRCALVALLGAALVGVASPSPSTSSSERQAQPPTLAQSQAPASASTRTAAEPTGQAPAQVIPQASPQPRTSLPRLRVSDNKHFLVTADGAPFFWLGDTAWELFHRLSREDAARYLENRSALRFTVIQAVVLAEFDGLTVPNAYGDLPLRDNDLGRPNEAYFAHVDWIVARANALGLYVGMLPTWGDKWNKKWGSGPEIFTPDNAARYGEWLGRRYKNAGIVWILGGDRPIETDAHRAIINAMAGGLRRGDGGAHLMTYHPGGGHGSAEYLHAETWLDFNMRQNGHGLEFTGRYDQTRVDYDRTPTKPVIDAEPIYEGHPVSFDAKKFGHSIAADVRRPLYWDLFSGACGHTYGHHSIWQMWTPARAPINDPRIPWTEAIDTAAAHQMQHARALIESRPFLSRIPDQSLIVADDRVPTHMPGAGRYAFVATRDEGRTYAMVYAPVSRTFTVRVGALRGANMMGWWFNPRTGAAMLIGTFPNTGDRAFTPPDAGELMDWILVLDDATAGYPAPGFIGFRRPDSIAGEFNYFAAFFPLINTSIESGRSLTKSIRVSPFGVCRTTAGIDSHVRYQPFGSTTELRGRPKLRSNTSSSPSSR
jgi:hypothetical protein